MKILNQFDTIFSSIITAIIVILTVSAVGLRYIFNSPLAWIEEVLISLYIWMIMIGAVSAMKSRKHISIDAINMLLSKKHQRWLQYFNDIVSIIVLLVFGYVGYELAQSAIQKITPILGISYYYIDLAIPIGSVWMAFYLAADIYKNATSNKDDA